MRTVKPHFGKAADVAKVVAIGHRFIRRQADLDRDFAGIGTRNLRRQKAVVGPRCGAAHLPNFALIPVVAADQGHIGDVAGLNLLEIPFRKLNGYEPMRAVGKIK
jgi:hypothetical protein